MRKLSLAALAATFFAPLSATYATAHVSLQQTEAAPGTYKAVLGIPHGCDGEPTSAVRVQIPEGFIGAKPMPKPGWSIEIEEGDFAGSYTLHGEEVSSGPVAVTWTGGSLDDRHYDEFVVRGTLSGVKDGQRLFFRTIQTCPSGKQETWTEEAGPGEDVHTLDRPAPFITIAAKEASGGHHAHGSTEATAGDLRITGAWARAMLPGQPSGGAYMTIENAGDEPDTLISVTSSIAGKVEVHTMEMKDEVMIMRPLEGGLEIPAGGSVALEPGGRHLMFMQVEPPFAEGSEVPVTLEFEKAGEVEFTMPVLPARTGRGVDAHQH